MSEISLNIFAVENCQNHFYRKWAMYSIFFLKNYGLSRFILKAFQEQKLTLFYPPTNFIQIGIKDALVNASHSTNTKIGILLYRSL